MVKIVSASTSTTDVQGLYTALNAYAVPKYFDRVEAVDNGDNTSYVSCFADGVEVVRIGSSLYYSASIPNGGINVRNAVGEMVNVYGGYNGGSYSKTLQITESAIAFTDSTGSLRPVLCRNVEDALAVGVCPYFTSNNSHTLIKSMSVGDSELSSVPYSWSKTDAITGHNALLPIYTEKSYLKDVWWKVLSQYAIGNEPIDVLMDGKTYYNFYNFMILDE